MGEFIMTVPHTIRKKLSGGRAVIYAFCWAFGFVLLWEAHFVILLHVRPDLLIFLPLSTFAIIFCLSYGSLFYHRSGTVGVIVFILCWIAALFCGICGIYSTYGL